MHMKVIYSLVQLFIQIAYVFGAYYEEVKDNTIPNADILLDVEAPSKISCILKCKVIHAETLYKNGRCQCFQVSKGNVTIATKPVTLSGKTYKEIEMPVNCQVLHTCYMKQRINHKITIFLLI